MNRKIPGWIAIIVLTISSLFVIRFGMGVHSTLANLDTLSQQKIMDFEQQLDQQAQKNREKNDRDELLSEEKDPDEEELLDTEENIFSNDEELY